MKNKLMSFLIILTVAGLTATNVSAMKRKRLEVTETTNNHNTALINQQLIPEIFAMIFGYFPQEHLRTSLRTVCKSWNKLILQGTPFRISINKVPQNMQQKLLTFLTQIQKIAVLVYQLNFSINLNTLNNTASLSLNKSFCSNKQHLASLPPSIEELIIKECDTAIINLSRLNALKIVELYCNEKLDIKTFIENLPASIEKLKLRCCNVIKIDLSKFKNLKQLDLSFNFDLGTESIITTCPESIEELNLSGCNIITIDLSKFKNLKKLDLSFNVDIGIGIGIESLATICRPESIEELNLNTCNILNQEKTTLEKKFPNAKITY